MNQSTLSILAVLSLAACASDSATKPTEEMGDLKVLQQHCDANAAVDGVQVMVTGPGVFVISWKNKLVCGTPT
jgi:uncharacterized lipoprotein YbaY